MVPRSLSALTLSQLQPLPCSCLPAIGAPYTSSQGESKWQLLFLSFIPFSQSRQQQQGPHDSMVSFQVMGLKPLPLSVPSSFDSTSCYFPHYYAFMPPEIGCWKSMYFSDPSFPKAHLRFQWPDRYSFTQHNLVQSATSSLGSYWEELSKNTENGPKQSDDII